MMQSVDVTETGICSSPCHFFFCFFFHFASFISCAHVFVFSCFCVDFWKYMSCFDFLWAWTLRGFVILCDRRPRRAIHASVRRRRTIERLRDVLLMENGHYQWVIEDKRSLKFPQILNFCVRICILIVVHVIHEIGVFQHLTWV